MRRREFITLLGGDAVAWPIGARAQQGAKIARIGIVEDEGAPDRRATVMG
jgi:putative ABC transport system substrate-binding protein